MTGSTDTPITAKALIDAAALVAARSRCRPASPAALGRAIIPDYRITPAVALISDALADAITRPGRRLIITVPPRESKSTTVAVAGTLWALSRDPDTNVILASYADDLAQEHSHKARALVAEHSPMLGFALSADRTAVGRWKVDGHSGGLLAAGILSGITGFGCSLLVLDDVVKNAQEADSPAYRRRVIHEFRSTLMSRLHPGGSVVIIGTRWNEADLIGTLLAEEPHRWTYLNVPAVGEAGVPDALGRAPGQAMTSALGRTPEQFADIRQAVASRSWHALFQGVPCAPEGNLIRSEWLDSHRRPAAPARSVRTIVAVDPADSGEGDETGIVAASLAPDGTVCLIADVSEQLTSDAWANRAVELAIMLGASGIVVEGFSAATTYVRLVTEALHRQRPAHHINVSSWPPRGRSRVGDALARSAGLLAALENGRCVIGGHLPDLEAAMVGWQPGAHQPDCVAASVIAFDVLAGAARGRWSFAAPVGVAGSCGASAGSGGGGFAEALGGRRPMVDVMVARAAAAKSGDPAAVKAAGAEEKQVVSITSYLSRSLGLR